MVRDRLQSPTLYQLNNEVENALDLRPRQMTILLLSAFRLLALREGIYGLY